MFRGSKSRVIEAPSEPVLACLTDVGQHAGSVQSFGFRLTETSPGEPRVGYLGRLEDTRKNLTISFRLEITEFVPHSRIAFLQSKVYTAATVLGRTKTQGIRPTSRTSESAYRISYDLEPVGLGTRLTRNSEPAGQWWALPGYLVWPLVQPIRTMNQSLILRMIKAQLDVNNV